MRALFDKEFWRWIVSEFKRAHSKPVRTLFWKEYRRLMKRSPMKNYREGKDEVIHQVILIGVAVLIALALVLMIVD